MMGASWVINSPFELKRMLFIGMVISAAYSDASIYRDIQCTWPGSMIEYCDMPEYFFLGLHVIGLATALAISNTSA